jgi:hypothetical protein
MKKLSLLIVFVFIGLISEAQIRHVRGIKSVDLGYGVSAFGTIYNVGYVSYRSNTTYLKGALFYESGIGNGVHYKSMGLQAVYAKTIVSSAPKYYLNAIVGGHASLDSADPLVDFNVPSTFKAGILVGLENEIFITDNFVFIVTFHQNLLLGSEFGNYRWMATGGIRYNF